METRFETEAAAKLETSYCKIIMMIRHVKGDQSANTRCKNPKLFSSGFRCLGKIY